MRRPNSSPVTEPQHYSVCITSVTLPDYSSVRKRHADCGGSLERQGIVFR
jgi:hypothetical protein